MACLSRILTFPFRLVFGLLKVLLGILLALVLVVAGINAFVWVTTSSQVVTSTAAAQTGAEAIVVPGASVLADGTPSAVLKDRLDTAVTLYNAGAAKTVMVSGSTSSDGYCEAIAMANYLVARGIPESAIVKDLSGESTYATMYHAYNTYGFKNIIIASQAYHLPRCIFCAQGIGMKAVGVDAGLGHSYDNQAFYSVREIFSNVKDAWQVFWKVPANTTTAAQTLADNLERATL